MEIITKIDITDNSLDIYTNDEHTTRPISPISIKIVHNDDKVSIYDNTYIGNLVFEQKKITCIAIEIFLNKSPVNDVSTLIGSRFKQHFRRYVVKTDQIYIKHTMELHLQGILEIIVTVK